MVVGVVGGWGGGGGGRGGGVGSRQSVEDFSTRFSQGVFGV